MFLIYKNDVYQNSELSSLWEKYPLNTLKSPWQLPDTWKELFIQHQFLKQNGRKGLKLKICNDGDPWAIYFFLAVASAYSKTPKSDYWILDQNNNPLLDCANFIEALKDITEYLNEDAFGFPWSGISNDYDFGIWWGDINNGILPNFNFSPLLGAKVNDQINRSPFAAFSGWTLSTLKNEKRTILENQCCNQLHKYLSSVYMNMQLSYHEFGFQPAFNENINPNSYFRANPFNNKDQVITFCESAFASFNNTNIAYDPFVEAFNPKGIFKYNNGEITNSDGILHIIEKNICKLFKSSKNYDSSATPESVLKNANNQIKVLLSN